MKYLILLSFFISFTLYVIHNIHIYQLNYYKPEVQRKWLNNNLSMLSVNISLSLIQMILFLVNEHLLVLIAGVLVVIYNLPKKAKKKLIYTPRVKRMIFEIYVFLLLILAVGYFNNINSIYYLCFAYFILTPITLLFVDYTQKPLNEYINNRFINEAKDILKEHNDLLIIGITGSYGKTSMKYFVTEFLKTKYNVLMTPGNYNTTLGVVRTIRENLKSTHEIFICEMGATKPRDIKEICDLVHPEHGIITSIGPQHLESFKTIETVLQTKFELADSLPDDGTLFLNYDNEYIIKRKSNHDIIKYAVDNDNTDYQAKDIKISNEGLTFKVKGVKFTTKLIGKHNVLNIVGALAVSEKLGVKLKDLVEVVRKLEPVPHRLELKDQGRRIIIDDAYNSNPMGAESALEAMNGFKGIKVIVTPGMVELGAKENEYNYKFGKQIAAVCDYTILVNENQTKSIYQGLIDSKYKITKIFVVKTIEEAFKKLDELNREGKLIVLLENDLPDQY